MLGGQISSVHWLRCCKAHLPKFRSCAIASWFVERLAMSHRVRSKVETLQNLVPKS